MTLKLFEKKVLGIDFRDDRIIAVCLKKGIAGFQLISSISIPFNGKGATDDTASDFKKFLTQNAIETKIVSVSVPKEWALSKFMDIPSPDKDTLKDVMRYEIERHIPFDIEEVFYDFQIIAEKQNNYNVILVAIQKEKISTIKDFLEKISLKPDNISISSLNNLNALELSEYNTNILTELSGISKRPDVFGNIDSICISVYVNSTGYEIAVIKNGYCFSLNTGSLDLKASNDTILNILASEIKKTIAVLNGKKPERIVLAGHAASELKHLIAGTCEHITLVKNLSCLSVNSKDQNFDDILSATGACYSSFGLGSMQINLLPVKGRRDNKTGAMIAKISFALIIILLCTIAARKINSEKIFLKAIEREISDKKPKVIQIEKMSSELTLADKKIKYLKKVEDRTGIELDMLAELSKILPENVWLSGFRFVSEKAGKNNGEVILSGFAKSYSNLIQLIEDSPYFENAEFTKPITKSTFGEAFEISASVVLSGIKNQGLNK